MWGTIDLKYGILTKILVVFATIETMSNKTGKKITSLTQNPKCKKNNWRIFAFFVGMKHAYLYDPICHAIFNLKTHTHTHTHTYIYILWSNHYIILSVFLFCL